MSNETQLSRLTPEREAEIRKEIEIFKQSPIGRLYKDNRIDELLFEIDSLRFDLIVYLREIADFVDCRKLSIRMHPLNGSKQTPPPDEL